ncbi:hypothetical protein JRI60_41575 [Archangium violaceum]|uniref:hypothetical protein n=1 Tax=Archangium violaceum TaxID=83451 RepID=UPI00194DF6D1|nr:hypothetical protein [Archangium violaceum]QRN95492.1 hypothetical protein JRI60_41575 [Archangium violaceum]
MLRFMSSLVIVGLVLSPLGSEAWAQGRTRAAKAAAARGKNRGKAAPPKAESAKQQQAEPASARVSDPVPGEPAAAASGAPPTRGPARIDFDDRLIQGQTNKSGAVYLYDRKELKTRSMIRERENFRSEILSTVYDQP